LGSRMSMTGGSTTSLDEALDEAYIYRACRAGELTATKHVIAPRHSLLHDDNDNSLPQAEAPRKSSRAWSDEPFSRGWAVFAANASGCMRANLASSPPQQLSILTCHFRPP
jgi:hypothetical protein